MKQAIEVKVAIVIVLGLLLVTSSIFAMAPMWVMAKHGGDSGTSGGSDSGKGSTDTGSGGGDKGSGNSDGNNGGNTNTDTGTNTGTDTGSGTGNSDSGSGGSGKPDQGVVSPEQGPSKNPVPGVPGNEDPTLGPIGGAPGLPSTIHKQKIPTIHQNINIIIVIKSRIQHSNSGGGGGHTHTPAGTYWNNEDMATLGMIWANGIKKGQDPVVDQFMTRMVG